MHWFDTNKTTNDNKYPWQNKDYKRRSMTDRENDEWYVTFGDWKLTKEQQIKVFDWYNTLHNF